VQDLLETDETAPDPLPMRVENSSMNLDDEVIRLLKHASQNFNDYPPKNPLYFLPDRISQIVFYQNIESFIIDFPLWPCT